MKIARGFLSIIVGLSTASALSFLVLPSSIRSWPSIRQTSQSPIMGIPFLGGQGGDNGPSNGGQMISDIIGKERAVNIFASFTRDIDTVSSRLDDKTKNSTVLAPSNSELQKLPRKPWEDPEDYNAIGDSAYKGEAGEDRAHRNLRRFVEAHIVPQSPWEENEKVNTLNGDVVWWENKDGKQVLQPGAIEISSTESRVENGEVWVIKGVLNYS